MTITSLASSCTHEERGRNNNKTPESLELTSCLFTYEYNAKLCSSEGIESVANALATR